MNTCEDCTFKAPDKDWCEYWRDYAHVRGTNRACAYFIQRKP